MTYAKNTPDCFIVALKIKILNISVYMLNFEHHLGPSFGPLVTIYKICYLHYKYVKFLHFWRSCSLKKAFKHFPNVILCYTPPGALYLVRESRFLSSVKIQTNLFETVHWCNIFQSHESFFLFHFFKKKFGAIRIFSIL